SESVEKPEEMRVIRKEKRSKKERGPCPDGKVENAMKPRFPLSHRACHQRRTDHQTENPNHKGGRSDDRHHRPKPATDPAVSNCRHPAVLVDAGQVALADADPSPFVGTDRVSRRE